MSGEGLFQVVEHGLYLLGITSINERGCAELVGIGMDGASANVANNEIKGLLERKMKTIQNAVAYV